MLNQKQYKTLILLEIKKNKKNITTFFIIEEAKETALHFSKETIKVLWLYFV